jgi:DNA-binding beta-propeller fold protein YncE
MSRGATDLDIVNSAGTTLENESSTQRCPIRGGAMIVGAAKGHDERAFVTRIRRELRHFGQYARGPTLVLLSSLSLLNACSNGSSGDRADETQPPEIEISFPFEHARYNAGVISVTGRIVHPELEKVQIAARAGGVEVQGLIVDGAFIVPHVPIAGEGQFTLSVTATHTGGVRTTRTLTISREPELTDVPAMVLDSNRARMIIVDRYTTSIVAAPLDGSARTIVSSGDIGSGPALKEPVALAIDAALDIAYVADDELDALFRVHLATGDRVIVSDEFVGAGPRISTPKEVDFDSSRGVVLVSDEYSGILAIDPATGERRLVTGSSSPGEPINFYRGIGVDAANSRYIVSDSASLFTVDPSTGARSMLSSWLDDRSFGRFFRGMSVSAVGGSIYIADDMSDGVLRIDPMTGAREQLTSSGLPAPWDFPILGSGPSLQYPNDVVFNHASRRLFVIEGEYADPLIEIEANGDRRVVRDAGLGSGLHFRAPSGIKYDAPRRRLVVSDYVADIVVAIDPSTGSRTTVYAPSNGRGTINNDLMDVAVHPSTGVFYVVDWQTDALYSIDAETGARTIVSDANTGSGTALFNPEQIVIDAAENLAYVASYQGGLLNVNLSSGERRLVGDFSGPVALAFDGSRRHLYVVEGYAASLHRIDLATGANSTLTSFGQSYGAWSIAYDRGSNSIIAIDEASTRLIGFDLATSTTWLLSGAIGSLPERGQGPRIIWPRGVAVDSEKQTAFVADDAYDAIIAVDLRTGDRQVISK